MWLVWIIALVLVAAGVVWYFRRLDRRTRSGPPYESAGSATAENDEGGKPHNQQEAE